MLDKVNSPTYAIRRYKSEDVPTAVEIMQRFHAETSYKDVPFSVEKVANTLRHNLKNDLMSVLLLTKNDRIIGGAWGIITPYFFAKETCYADVFGIYVLPEDRHARATNLLFDGIVDWAKRRNVDMLNMAISTDRDIEKFERVMGLFKLDRVGSIWQKRLSR